MVSDFWTPRYTVSQIKRANQRLFTGVLFTSDLTANRLFMFPLAALPDGDKGHLASWNGSVRDRGKAEMRTEQHPGLYSILWLKQFSMSAVESSFTICEVLPEFPWNNVRHRSQKHWELRWHGCYFAWALYLPYSLYSSTHLLYVNKYFVYILFIF